MRNDLVNFLCPRTLQSFGPARFEDDASQEETEGRQCVYKPAEGVVDVWGAMWAEDYERISEYIEEAENNSAIEEIVLLFDTPGGSSCLVPETAEQIRNCSKTVHAFVKPCAASAGLFLASACHKIHVPKSGWMGSLGSYMLHIDYTKWLEDNGVKYDFIKAPERKAYIQMPEDSRDHYQEIINDLTKTFIESVAKYRGKSVEFVKENFGGGEMLTGKQAVAVGMADDHLSFRDFTKKKTGQENRAQQAIARSRRLRRLKM